MAREKGYDAMERYAKSKYLWVWNTYECEKLRKQKNIGMPMGEIIHFLKQIDKEFKSHLIPEVWWCHTKMKYEINRNIVEANGLNKNVNVCIHK